ncbi:prefoldin subunit 5 [Phasianus colchicus]|nr:prefoldin subunit 5 [Phasianus colchicus]
MVHGRRPWGYSSSHPPVGSPPHQGPLGPGVPSTHSPHGGAALSPQEVEFLSSSITQLKVVQTKYVEAKDCLNVLNKSNEGKDLLVPLTSSMYVPGKLSDVERVLIDVGTGYYVEKTADDAREFFKRKIDFLTKQMEKIQPALQEKHAMKQAVVEMMSQKIQQLTALGAAQGATTKA